MTDSREKYRRNTVPLEGLQCSECGDWHWAMCPPDLDERVKLFQKPDIMCPRCGEHKVERHYDDYEQEWVIICQAPGSSDLEKPPPCNWRCICK